MNISHSISTEIKTVRFSFYGPDEIKKISVKAITNPLIFDTMDHPTTNGLYDPALGPHEKGINCTTCNLDSTQCPGHFGHIELTLPTYNPITFRLMLKLLKSTCHFCHHFKLSDTVTAMFVAKLKLTMSGLLVQASALDTIINVKPGKKDPEDQDSEETLTKEGIIEEIENFVSKAIKEAPKKFVKVSSTQI